MTNDPDGNNISIEEMGTFDGALLYTLAVAHRWGVIDVPPGKQVLVAGVTFDRDWPTREGTAIAVDVDREMTSTRFLVTDCDFIDCSAIGVAETIIELAQRALGTWVPPEPAKPWLSRLRFRGQLPRVRRRRRN